MKSSKGLIYLLLMFATLALLILIPMYVIEDDPLKADIHLSNSKSYLLREYDYERSHDQLRKAIQAMRDLEEGLDEESKFIIETSIKDLDKVSKEIENKALVKGDMSVAYAKALDALTYAEIRISEHLLDIHASKEAVIALKYGMVHLRNAIKFSDSETLKQFEMHIYEELDSLIENNTLTHDEMKKKLDHMLVELDHFVEDKDSIR